MKNNLVTQVENYLETGDQASLLKMKNRLFQASNDEKQEFKALLGKSEEILSGDQNHDETKSETADEILEADSEEAQKVSMPKDSEIIDEKKPEIELTRDTEVEDDTDSDSGFTINPAVAPKEHKNFLDVDWQKPIKFSRNKEVAVNKEGEKTEKAPLYLQVELRNAVDKYNELIAKAVGLKKVIEAMGGESGEIPKINITNILEDPRLHDPRVPSAVKSRMLQELNNKLKNTDAKTKTEEYEELIVQIEPAKTLVSDALDAILAKTSNSFDAEKIRLSMAKLVVEDDVTIAHKQDWDAICINRKAEIDEQASEQKEALETLPNVSPKIIEAINEPNSVNKIDETKATEKKADELPAVSPDIIKDIDEIGSKTAEATAPSDDNLSEDSMKIIREMRNSSSSPVKWNLGGGEPTKTDEGKTENINNKPALDALSDKPNIYEDVIKESTDINAGEPSTLTADSKLSESLGQSTDVTEAESNLPKAGEFVEFITADEKGALINPDTVKSTEVGLDDPKTDVKMDAPEMADLLKKGDGVPKTTGVVNFDREDLDDKIPTPDQERKTKITDKRHAIRQRLEELKNADQTIYKDLDMFGSGKEEPIKDIDNKPIVSIKEEIPMPSAKDKETLSKDTEKEDLEQKNITAPVEKIEPQVLQEPEILQKPEVPAEKYQEAKPEEEIKKEEAAPVAKGPALVAEPVINSEQLGAQEAVAKNDKAKKTKRFDLFTRLKQIAGLGENFTTDKLQPIEEDVMRKRSTAIEEKAEQAQK